MRNKNKIKNIILVTVMTFAIAVTGCSASTSDEEAWNQAGNVIDADSVDEEIDYSKFEEKEESKDKKEESSKESNDSKENSTSGAKGNKDSGSKDKAEPEKETSSSGSEKEDPKRLTCSISISCSTILSNMDKLKEGKEGLVPSSGVILGSTTVEYEEGDTVFDILKKVTRTNGIHMEYTDTPGYNSSYIEGIANLYENDCGPGSGWMYCVNGVYYDYGCSQYDVEEGDNIQWNYTCEMGNDL